MQKARLTRPGGHLFIQQVTPSGQGKAGDRQDTETGQGQIMAQELTFRLMTGEH